MLVAVAFMASACNSFEENAYKTIKSAATAYDSAMTIAADYYGDITDADEKAEFWASVEAVAKPVHAALVTAKMACMSYSKALAAYQEAQAAAANQTDISQLQTRLTAAKAAASAALAAVSADAMASAIQTIISSFSEE
jgi:hypothetical protein